MYSTTDFRKGLKIEVEGTPYEIIEFQHFKPGKGGAMVRTKLRNILTGRVEAITFRSGDKVGKPDIETRDMQYLYKDGGQECRVMLYQGRPLDIDIPMSVVLEVTDTEPGAKGDTVSNVTKAATLESGAVIQVPIFVNVGDRVKVNTGTKEYLGRE